MTYVGDNHRMMFVKTVDMNAFLSFRRNVSKYVADVTPAA